jgi:phosphoribosylglycinamide formyltransferase-1
VEEGDDEEALSNRILVEEHRILAEAVRLFCEGRLRLDGRKVLVL